MYRYAEVEAALAKVHRIAPAAMGAFRGRIKHLQKIGIVPSSPGRGKKITYGFGAIAAWAFCLELAEFGIDPTVIKTIHDFAAGIVYPTLLNDGEQEDQIMILIPHLMSKWSVQEWVGDPGVFMDIKPVSEATYEKLKAAMPTAHTDRNLSRVGLLNLSQIRRDLKEALGPSATWVQHGEAHASNPK